MKGKEELLKHFNEITKEYHQHCEWTPEKYEAVKKIRTLLNEAPKPKVSGQWVEDVISKLHHNHVKDIRRIVNYVLSALKIKVKE